MIFSERMEEDSLLLSKNPMEERSKAGIGYDCVICSSELHPVDDITLINAVKQGLLSFAQFRNNSSGMQVYLGMCGVLKGDMTSPNNFQQIQNSQ